MYWRMGKTVGKEKKSMRCPHCGSNDIESYPMNMQLCKRCHLVFKCVQNRYWEETTMMIKLSTVLIIALVYYVSFLIGRYNRFKDLSLESSNEHLFWRCLVWVSWLLYPLLLPMFILVYLGVELARKATRAIEDSRRYKYGRKYYKNQGKYHDDQRR